MRNSTIIVAAFAILVAGCRGPAARSSDDIMICKQYYSEALMRMDDLKHDTFQPGDLTFEQLRLLTPGDSNWRTAQFLVLSREWAPQKDEKKIVIICGQSRVNKSGQRVHCVGYSTGETAWLREDELDKLQLRDFSVTQDTAMTWSNQALETTQGCAVSSASRSTCLARRVSVDRWSHRTP